MDYKGDEISFSEWPQGLEIYYNLDEESITKDSIIIRSPVDAKNIIKSLEKYLETFNKTT